MEPDLRERLLLGVNIDHVATIRQARGTNYPSVLEAAAVAEDAGADAITVHLREDRRHIQDEEVEALCRQVKTRVNLEMAVTDEMLAIAEANRPADVCLVPEKREELTTEGGLDVCAHFDSVRKACGRLSGAGIRVSLFIDPDREQLEAARDCGAPVVELHTGRYNFLHRSWGPHEPFDDSTFMEMKRNDIYSHLVSDHYHYWEDGGSTYHHRYSSWVNVRGQEGDHWKGHVADPDVPEHYGRLARHFLVNRQYMTEEHLTQIGRAHV